MSQKGHSLEVAPQLGWNYPEAHSSSCWDLGWEDLETSIADSGTNLWSLHLGGLPHITGTSGDLDIPCGGSQWEKLHGLLWPNLKVEWCQVPHILLVWENVQSTRFKRRGICLHLLIKKWWCFRTTWRMRDIATNIFRKIKSATIALISELL